MSNLQTLFTVTFLVCSFSLFAQQAPEGTTSELVILNVKSGEQKTVLKEVRHFEAPNWSRDGKYLIINSGGQLEKVDFAGKKLGKILPDKITRANNDHGLSFDGKLLVVSKSDENFGSRIYTVPITGGEPKLITPNHPSYWHGISPDGQILVYCAQRNGAWDIYSIPTAGGTEKRLTTSEGLDDGPEYSYDGKWTIGFHIHRPTINQL